MIWLFVCLLVVPFGLVLFVGAPYLPTRKTQAKQALDLLGLKKGDTFVDLGSGDGSVLIEAASRGLVCYGYELNPFIWLISKLRTLRFGSQVHISCTNFWSVSLPTETKGVFVFLLDKYMTKLDAKLSSQLQPGGKLVSYTFKIPSKKHTTSKGPLTLYTY